MRRSERLAGTLKEEIAEVVGFELDDPRLVSATVTDVEVAPDLRDAKVYVMIRGTEKEIADALSALRHAATFVRQQVAMNLDMRYAPHIHFARDAASENAERITDIMERIKVDDEA